MRCAIVSDVHANPEALEAALASEPLRTADAIICLGDVVGYYTEPDRCVQRIRSVAALGIAGNHDLAATGKLDPSDFGRHARTAIEWTKPRLSAESLGYLERLPLFANFEAHFSCVHGALHPEPNATLHLSNLARVDRSFERLTSGTTGTRICFFGHTHHAVAYESDGTRASALTGPSLRLSDDRFYLVNPGSLGQPRDGDRRASYVVYDTSHRSLEFHRIDYDFEAPLARARSAGLLDPPSLRARTSDWLGSCVHDARTALGVAARHVRKRSRFDPPR
jgi:predicted phosphodiesterase